MRERGGCTKIIDGLLAELEQEAETLALHVATVPGNVAELAALDTIPNPPAFVQPEAVNAAELVPSLQRERRESEARARRIRNERAVALVPPSRPVARLSAPAESTRAVCLRSDRRRESVHGVSESR